HELHRGQWPDRLRPAGVYRAEGEDALVVTALAVADVDGDPARVDPARVDLALDAEQPGVARGLQRRHRGELPVAREAAAHLAVRHVVAHGQALDAATNARLQSAGQLVVDQPNARAAGDQPLPGDTGAVPQRGDGAQAGNRDRL